ncbi:MAG: hypothetical protein HFI33_04590 [Lachnospiraceae bacterium]|nr:hypothetical protein [Lachnospiraceae bacterium]
MFEIFAMVGWVIVGILLLYLWADVREIKRDLKNCRRDMVRNSLGGRTSENYPGFSEEQYWKEARQEETEPAQRKEEKLPPKKSASLKPGEEQVLREILAEFLN